MKSIAEQFEEIKEEMCDKYCKMPALYRSEIDDPDIAQELLEMRCNKCPMNMLSYPYGKNDYME